MAAVLPRALSQSARSSQSTEWRRRVTSSRSAAAAGRVTAVYVPSVMHGVWQVRVAGQTVREFPALDDTLFRYAAQVADAAAPQAGGSDLLPALGVAAVSLLDVWAPLPFVTSEAHRALLSAVFLAGSLALVWRRRAPLAVLVFITTIDSLLYLAIGAPEALGTFLLVLVLAGLGFGTDFISPWLALVPLAGFFVLVAKFEMMRGRLTWTERAAAFYVGGLHRLTGKPGIARNHALRLIKQIEKQK